MVRMARRLLTALAVAAGAFALRNELIRRNRIRYGPHLVA